MFFFKQHDLRLERFSTRGELKIRSEAWFAGLNFRSGSWSRLLPRDLFNGVGKLLVRTHGPPCAHHPEYGDGESPQDSQDRKQTHSSSATTYIDHRLHVILLSRLVFDCERRR
jgi:hypothetical protein